MAKKLIFLFLFRMIIDLHFGAILDIIRQIDRSIRYPVSFFSIKWGGVKKRSPKIKNSGIGTDLFGLKI